VNECESENECDKDTTNCVNLKGSYRCDCKFPKHYAKTTMHKCEPLEFDYRLLDPSKSACCHRGRSGAFLLQGSHLPNHSPKYRALISVGCLILRSTPLPGGFRSKHLSEYVANDNANITGDNITVKMEMETLADFVDIVQSAENSARNSQDNAVPAIEIQTFIITGPPQNRCVKKYVRSVPTVDPSTNDSVLVRPVTGFLAIDRAADMYASPGSSGGCRTLPRNTQWLEERLYRRPTASIPSLYGCTDRNGSASVSSSSSVLLLATASSIFFCWWVAAGGSRPAAVLLASP